MGTIGVLGPRVAGADVWLAHLAGRGRSQERTCLCLLSGLLSGLSPGVVYSEQGPARGLEVMADEECSRLRRTGVGR